MSGVTLGLLVVALVVAAAIVYLLFSALGVGSDSLARQSQSILSAQRDGLRTNTTPSQRKISIHDSVAGSSVAKKADSASSLNLVKRLKYAHWKMTPPMFYGCEFVIAMISFMTIGQLFGTILKVASLLLGPLIMRFLLDRSLNKRFKAFDADYPSFLLSLVGLLKTGMNPITAIEAASAGLEEGSLMKIECELMLERMRVGVLEEQSIGSFAEDIYHPEIELFVQALLLSKRVGGTLSDTLDRLARQVRKRQYFRKQAIAAVAMQRGSIWFILGIMVCLMTYIWYIYPEAIQGAIANPTGWNIYQFGLGLILVGIYWVRQVTKIRV